MRLSYSIHLCDVGQVFTMQRLVAGIVSIVKNIGAFKILVIRIANLVYHAYKAFKSVSVFISLPVGCSYVE